MYVSVSQDCNTSLVRACWNELFTLGLAQCSQVMSLSTILAAIVNHLQSSIQDGTVRRSMGSLQLHARPLSFTCVPPYGLAQSDATLPCMSIELEAANLRCEFL